MSANIFISFASQDLKIANTICAAIEGRGFKCWISSRDILPGENFQSAIVRAIRGSQIMLLVFTANSNRSEEMTKELALASQKKLMVVPLRVEDVTPSDAFAYEFATRQWIDLFADWEMAMNQLCARIAAALANEPHSTEAIVLGKPSAEMTAAAASAASAAPASAAAAATKNVAPSAPLPFAATAKSAVRTNTAPAAAPAPRKRVAGFAIAGVAVLAGAGIVIGALSGKSGASVTPAANTAPGAPAAAVTAAGAADASQSASSLVVAAADPAVSAPAANLVPAVANGAGTASPALATDAPAATAATASMAATTTTVAPGTAATSAADEAAKAALRKKRLANKARASSNVPY